MLDPDQARCFVGPVLGPNCFQRLSADDTSRQKVDWVCMDKSILLSTGKRAFGSKMHIYIQNS